MCQSALRSDERREVDHRSDAQLARQEAIEHEVRRAAPLSKGVDDARGVWHHVERGDLFVVGERLRHGVTVEQEARRRRDDAGKVLPGAFEIGAGGRGVPLGREDVSVGAGFVRDHGRRGDAAKCVDPHGHNITFQLN